MRLAYRETDVLQEDLPGPRGATLQETRTSVQSCGVGPFSVGSGIRLQLWSLTASVKVTFIIFVQIFTPVPVLLIKHW